MLAHIESRSDYNPYCNISPQKAILVTLLAGECDSTVDTTLGITDHEKLAKCARASDEGLKSWKIAIDGETITENTGSPSIDNSTSKQFEVSGTPPFDVMIPKNNAWEINIDADDFAKFKVNDTALRFRSLPMDIT